VSTAEPVIVRVAAAAEELAEADGVLLALAEGEGVDVALGAELADALEEVLCTEVGAAVTSSPRP
jgi:hypothetical protein